MWYSLLGYQMENTFEEPSQFYANVWVLKIVVVSFIKIQLNVNKDLMNKQHRYMTFQSSVMAMTFPQCAFSR